MEEGCKYEQLRPEERVAIAGLRLQGAGVRQVARALGRSPATISREPGRNTDELSQYSRERAITSNAVRRRAARRPRKLTPESVTWQSVFPEQRERLASHETIYTTITPIPRAIADSLNTRPRATLGWDTPIRV